MSNRNYQNYKKEKEIMTESFVKNYETEVNESVESKNDKSTNETSKTNPIKKEIGKVNCIRLAIRNEPAFNGSIVCLARVGDELTIDRSKYYDGWLKVSTVDGLEGFCKQDFVTAI